MKKRWLWLGIFALAGVLFISCSDDDSESNPNNMQIYSIDYELVNGIIWHSTDNQVIETREYIFTDHFTDEEGNPRTVESRGFTVGENSRSNGNFLLTLYDAGLNLNPDLKMLRGKGACICFHLASPDKARLTPGTYTWGDKKEDFTFQAFYSSVFNPEELKTASAEIKKGTVVLDVTDEEYRISFDCETDFGAKIKGTYQGPLHIYQIESEDIALRSDVKIDALLDSAKMVLDMYLPEEYGGHITMDWLTPGPDFYQGESFYAVTTGVSSVAASASGNKTMDLALVWNRKSESVFFESPLKMCVWLSHQYSCEGIDFLSFPCHTCYMAVPDDFTDETFEKISGSSDLDFILTGEPKVEIPLNASLPVYVFFETGNGVRGIIKIKSTSPFKVKVTDASELSGGWPATLTSHVNPSITVDIKYVSPLPDRKIR